MSNSDEKTKPFDRIRYGAVQAAIWRHTNAEGYARYGVTFQRRYRDPETGEWKSNDSFNRDELLTLAKLADLANTRIHELQTEDRRRHDQANGASEAAEIAVTHREAAVAGGVAQ